MNAINVERCKEEGAIGQKYCRDPKLFEQNSRIIASRADIVLPEVIYILSKYCSYIIELGAVKKQT